MIKFGACLVVIAACVCVTLTLPQCACPRDLKKVCGSDGETYLSECYVECVRKSEKPDLRIVKNGACDTPNVVPSDCICTLEYAPVCGSNGRTYPNECSLRCERSTTPDLTVSYNGQCKEQQSCVCTFEYKPVCGTNGRTYPNECALRCEKSSNGNLEVKNLGECQNDEVKVVNLPTCICTREMKQVCGSDGITYNNPCLLNCAAQVRSSALSVEHVGPCENKVRVVEQPAPNAPACTCTRNLDPVCGSDGITFNNECLLRCAGASLARMGSCA